MLGRPLSGGAWLGWRSRLLALAALAGCLGLFLLVRVLSLQPMLDMQWRADSQGRLVLVSGPASTSAREGMPLIGMLDASGSPVEVDTLMLHRSARWLVSDNERQRHASLHDRLSAALAAGPVTLLFEDGETADASSSLRGFTRLGTTFWLMSTLALLLYLVAMIVVLVKPRERNVLYAVMASCQSANLVFIAVEALPGLTLPPLLLALDFPVRAGLDLVTGAAIVHATALHPSPLPWRKWSAMAAWCGAALFVAVLALKPVPHVWWGVQAAAIACGLASIVQLTQARRLEPHPAAVILRRLAAIAVGILTLLTFAMAAAVDLPDTSYQISAIGSTVWVVFLASLLALLPFLSRSQQVLREFSMLAGVSTVATSLDLLFIAVFSLGQFASVTLALFLSVGLYAGLRQWMISKILGTNMLTTERTFEQLYRIARAMESHPEQLGNRLSQLLREVFEPLETMLAERSLNRSRIVGDGSTLLVPVPRIGGPDEASGWSIVLRYAHRGTTIFTDEDARLTNRICEQLKRAVAFDQAVEQGRSEERARLAQDLHDDIGARLLTLMYKANDRETEEYVRHTLKDLKTLTRGLAASNHLLSHAAAEWKADLSQRLGAVHCELNWSFTMDKDIQLTVVEWSALTRALRELVNNVIAHACATKLEVNASFSARRLTITIADDGIGRDPDSWTHGLGLNGVRKRIRQLQGKVEWRQRSTQGIECFMNVPLSINREHDVGLDSPNRSPTVD